MPVTITTGNALILLGAAAPAYGSSRGSAMGAGSAAAVGAALFRGAGSASGSGTAAAVGAGASAGAGTAASAGTGAATAVGASLFRAVGVAAGSGSANGVSPSGSAGSAAGTGAAAAVGASSGRGAGASSGSGAAAGVGASLFRAVGAAVGSGSASGIAPGGAEAFTAGIMVHGGSEANPFVQGWIGFKRGDFFPTTMHLVATYPSHTIQCQHDAVSTYSDGSCRQAIVCFYMASTLSDGVEQLVTITPTAGAQAT